MTLSRRQVLAGSGVALLAAQVASAASVMPRGLSKDVFLTAVAEFRGIVGDANVIIDEATLVSYEKMMIPADPVAHQAAGAILVDSVEQIQRILVVCNEHKIPVWPISTGGNFGYGERLPAVPGQMVLDLGRMNKIIEVDVELCTALVEPGVTYHQLYEYLNTRGLPLWLSVPGPGPLVGPVGQALERGQGYTAIAEQFESICGIEVVLADGTVLRTGMGGIEGTTAWQANKYGYGPHVTGMFTQSNFGIVTKLGLWLTPRPETYQLFAASFDSFDDIDKSVDAARRLKLAHVVEGPILTGIPVSGMQMANGKRETIKSDPAPIDKAWLNDYCDRQKVPKLGAFGCVTGSAAEVRAKLAEVKRVFGEYGASVVDELFLQLAPMYQHMVHSMTGTPDLREMNMLNWVGGGGCAWFATVCPTRGAEAKIQMNLAWNIMEKHGFDYNGGFFHNGRSAIHAVSILFDRGDAEQSGRAKICFDDLHDSFAAKGYGAYRTNIAMMARTAEVYGAPQQATNLKIKASLDPNGIIAPGKSGILTA